MASIKEYTVPLVVLAVALVGMIGLINGSGEPNAYVIDDSAYATEDGTFAIDDGAYVSTAEPSSSDMQSTVSGMAVSDLTGMAVLSPPIYAWKPIGNAWGPPYCNEYSRLKGPALCSRPDGRNLAGQDCSTYPLNMQVKTAYDTGHNFQCQDAGVWTPSADRWGAAYCHCTTDSSDSLCQGATRYNLPAGQSPLCVSPSGQNLAGQSCAPYPTGLEIKTAVSAGSNFKCLPAIHFLNPTPGVVAAAGAKPQALSSNPTKLSWQLLPGYTPGELTVYISEKPDFKPTIEQPFPGGNAIDLEGFPFKSGTQYYWAVVDFNSTPLWKSTTLTFTTPPVWKVIGNFWGPPYCNEASRLKGPALCSRPDGRNLAGQVCSAYPLNMQVKTAYDLGHNFQCS